jgi:hypothetical protein
MSTTDQLSTIVTVQPFFPQVTYDDKIVMAGSCFAEHMAQKLSRYKYNVQSNPFGILYNPASLASSFERIAHNDLYRVEELVYHDGLYHSMDHHGSFSGVNAEDTVQKINSSIEATRNHIRDSKFIFVSLGTSRIYRYKETGKIAGNNHKIPMTHFEPGIISIEECYKEMERLYQAIHQLTPHAHVIWTVSPIRHIKDGLVENQRSKAALILAIEQFLATFSNTVYFPAYEIMIDQLRDYRFYARDLIHPSELAVDIIWEVFCNTYLDPRESQHHSSIEKIKKAMEHRILHNNKTAIKNFAAAQLRSLDHLASIFPDMNLKEERQYFFHLNEPD